MTLLRVALLSLHQDRLHVHCFGDLAELAAAVQILLSNPQRRFVIDAGFEDFEHKESNRDLFAGESRVLISDRALCLLREHVSAETYPAAEVDKVKFYAPRTVWGQICKEAHSLKVSRSPVGWVAELSRHDSFLAEYAQRAGIWDEESYRTVEGGLSGTLRVSLARSRFILLAGTPPSPLNILDQIGCCPSWVQERRFDSLPINGRQANVMRAHRLACIGDLAKVGTNGLLKLPNLGLKSVRELGDIVYDVLISEPSITEVSIETAVPINSDQAVEDLTFFDSIRRWLDAQDSTLATVMRNRWGIDTEEQTLQQVAALIGVTSERIRQIELKGVAKLKTLTLWEEMSTRIERVLSERTSPLNLEDLPKEDPWFASSGGSTVAFRAGIQNFLEGRIHTFSINDDVVVTGLSETGWIRATNDARVILGDLGASGSAVRAERLVTAILAKEGAELRGLLLATLDVEDPFSHQACEATSDVASEDDDLAQKLKTEMLRRQLSRVA